MTETKTFYGKEKMKPLTTNQRLAIALFLAFLIGYYSFTGLEILHVQIGIALLAGLSIYFCLFATIIFYVAVIKRGKL